MDTFKAAFGTQIDGGIERSDCNADLLVGGRGATLGRGDVWAPLEGRSFALGVKVP